MKNNGNSFFNFDDKDLAILGASAIAVFAMYRLTEPETIILACITGIFGLAAGRKK